MMYLAILTALLTINIVNGFTNRVKVIDLRNNVGVNNLPDYEIPNWVYKKVFKHNKIKNKNSLKNLQEKRNNYIFNSEEENMYNAIKICNLPMGLLQPINRNIM
jgi:hypothetical protein